MLKTLDAFSFEAQPDLDRRRQRRGLLPARLYRVRFVTTAELVAFLVPRRSSCRGHRPDRPPRDGNADHGRQLQVGGSQAEPRAGIR